jgi:hypothetical protein
LVIWFRIAAKILRWVPVLNADVVFVMSIPMQLEKVVCVWPVSRDLDMPVALPIAAALFTPTDLDTFGRTSRLTIMMLTIAAICFQI